MPTSTKGPTAKRYTPGEKRKVISYANQNGSIAASEKFHVAMSSIAIWKKRAEQEETQYRDDVDLLKRHPYPGEPVDDTAAKPSAIPVQSIDLPATEPFIVRFAAHPAPNGTAAHLDHLIQSLEQQKAAIEEKIKAATITKKMLVAEAGASD